MTMPVTVRMLAFPSKSSAGDGGGGADCAEGAKAAGLHNAITIIKINIRMYADAYTGQPPFV